MGKFKTKTDVKYTKMEDALMQRQKTTLKRSKSVRESLRFIGTKFLSKNHHHNNNNNKEAVKIVTKSPSLSSLHDFYKTQNKPDIFLDNIYERKPIATILKTPMGSSDLIHEKVSGNTRPFKNEKLNKNKRDLLDGHLKISAPPEVVPRKAAQVLQVGSFVKELEINFEVCSSRYDNNRPKENMAPFKKSAKNETADQRRRSKSDTNCPKHGKFSQYNYDYRHNGFYRGALRLSMANRRKVVSNMRNSSFSEDYESNQLPTLSGDLLDMEVANLPLHRGLAPPNHKPSKKEVKILQQKMEKLARINIHLHALFAAVENAHLEKARTILESTEVDVNSVSADMLSPLDIAVLSNNRPMAKMLISFGAKEGSRFANAEKMGCHLKQLLGEAEMRLQELGGLLDEPCGAPLNTRASFSSIIGQYPAASMTGCAGGDTEKQAIAWGRKAKMLKKLVLGFAQARPPDPPSLVAIDITGPSCVTVRLQEPTSSDSPISTKFRVQWSTRADFIIVTGEKEITDLSNPRCAVELTQGRRYFFRASCGNLRGYGTYLMSTPSSIIPSTWREIDRRESRFGGRLKQLESLMEEVKQIRPGTELLDTPGPQRRAQRKKTTIKQLFTAASKFQKHLRRGIYLACILYHEDKVLVTNEDFLPVIEIDENFPSCIHTDLHWLMKVACTWDDTKCLRQVMEEHSSSAIHFRTKLLSAALQMQSSLCLQDLGQLYYKPLRDSQGSTVVLSTINYVKSPKSVSVLNSRWLPMNKIFKKAVLSDDHNISDILMASIQDQINYHQVSGLKLGKGLYLAYLKMQSSVDLIQVVVSAKSPNMLPHCKVRDNPHVSAEEWNYLKQQHLPDILDNSTELQRTFLELVTSAAKRLFNYMDISTEEANQHRLYDAEVVDLTDEVSFVVICPSAEFSCSVPGQREMLLQRGDLLSLPIQVFEMIHLNTYQTNTVRKYSKLSCLLELDTATASHMHREAFSNTEVAVAKERLNKLQDLQNRLNYVWKSVRWLMDVISFARDRAMNGISMRYILEKEIGVCTSPKRSLLQLPPRETKVMKTPGRGSWPGPGAGNTIPISSTLTSEFSKSEQQLNLNGSASHYLTACSDSGSRKNSDSYSSDYFSQLPPSKSEDMLFSLPNASPQRQRTVGAHSSTSATTSPLLSVRPVYGGSMISVNTLNTTDSLHSLSSDSDPQTQPIGCSTPQKTKHRIKMTPSRSMTNVKQNVLDVSMKSENIRPKFLSVETHLRPNNNNLETSLSKSLTNIRTITDEESPKHNKFKKPADQNPDLLKVPLQNRDPSSEQASSSSKDQQQSGILQVFAAYETGLASGTSLKLHVTPRTTAREVVDLVVKQLNMAVVLKGKDGPIYSADKLKNFCLVAVIGARERCLRDDFKPLQLQNPWKKGRLYVRQKQEVLAALEHSSKHSAII